LSLLKGQLIDLAQSAGALLPKPKAVTEFFAARALTIKKVVGTVQCIEVNQEIQRIAHIFLRFIHHVAFPCRQRRIAEHKLRIVAVVPESVRLQRHLVRSARRTLARDRSQSGA